MSYFRGVEFSKKECKKKPEYGFSPFSNLHKAQFASSKAKEP